MSYTTAEGRQQVLDTVAQATEQLGMALSSLTEAYELLDENMAERLNESCSAPSRAPTVGPSARTPSLAERHGLPGRTFGAPPTGAPGRGCARSSTARSRRSRRLT